MLINANTPASTKAIVTIANNAADKASVIEILVGQSIPQRLGYGKGVGVGEGNVFHLR